MRWAVAAVFLSLLSWASAHDTVVPHHQEDVEALARTPRWLVTAIVAVAAFVVLGLVAVILRYARPSEPDGHG